MSIAKATEVKIIALFKRWRGLIITVGVMILGIYLLFYNPATQLTWEGLIDLLSKRNPPTWLVPSFQGQTIDVQQTKNFKRKKLAQLKKEVYQAKQDFSVVFTNPKESVVDSTGENVTPWLRFKEDLSDVTFTFVEFWGVTVVTYPGQGEDEEQTILVGAGSKPINLNDQVLRWQKEIEAAAKHYDLEPALIAAVIEQESGGDSQALSLTGAIGLMQLMPSTAELMGVNPYDPAQNIDGGAHYLKIQLESFGNLQPALAAYNAGPGSVQNGNWTKIPETLNYVQKVPRLLSKYERIWQENH